jgi:hypothetical protein
MARLTRMKKIKDKKKAKAAIVHGDGPTVANEQTLDNDR